MTDRPAPITPPERYRRLTLLDLMGLVAVSGLSYAQIHRDRGPIASDRALILSELDVLVMLEALGLAWWVVLRGVSRSGVERTDPGYLTALGIVVASVINVGVDLVNAVVWLVRGTDPSFLAAWKVITRDLLAQYVTASVGMGSRTIAAGVVVVWITLTMIGGWTRSGGTLGRLGLAAGGTVVASFFVYLGLLVWEN